MLLLVVAFRPGQARAGFVGSKHDLSARSGSADAGADVVETDLCVFCHTPSGVADRETDPLWVPSSAGDGYQRYADLGTAMLGGKSRVVGSVSISCLSCHDGTQAADAIINAGGSGPGFWVPGSGFAASDWLRGHPVNVEYARGACNGVVGGCDPTAPGPAGADFNPASYANINGVPQWWVDTRGGTALREKSDMILYTRGSGNGAGGNRSPSVECASCHDPHNADSTPVSFLRMNNAGSHICSSCHAK